MNSKQKGDIAELLVCRYLEEKNYTILGRNWFCRTGEIDIIASAGKTVSFVEVKKIPRYWTDDVLEQKVDKRKQNKIIQSSFYYLASHTNIKYDDVSFDVASVCNDAVRYYKGAYE